MLERVFQEPKFRVCCLGRFKLVEASSGTDMTPASRKARALVGYLCAVGRPVGRERLASLLWGDRGDEQARASLRQAIYELRSMLAGDRLLKLERDTVAIGDDIGTDVAAIIAAAQSGDLEQLGNVLTEWQGDFFEDLPSIDESFDAWLQSERPRVHESLIAAAVEAARAAMAAGEIDPARKIVGLLQQREGTSEIVLRLGLELDYHAGDSAALHRRYERFRELLKAELDAAPALETQRLFQSLSARSSVPAGNIAPEPANDVADSTRDYIPSIARPKQPRAMPSAADVESLVSYPPAHADRSIRIAGAAFAVVGFCVLAWTVWSLLHKAVPPSVHLSPAVTNVSSTTGPERLLLGIDTHSEQSPDHFAAIEKAARTSAERASGRDPNDGEALGVLAVLTPSTRLQALDRLFQHALRSDPDNAQLLNWHGRFLMTVGRNHEALGELTRAYERDRAAPSIASNLILAFLLVGRFEEAREIIDLDRRGSSAERFFPLHVKYFLYKRDWFGLANYLHALPDYLSPPRAAFFRLCRETAIAFVAREVDRFGPLRASWRTETSVDPDDAVQFLSALGDDEGALGIVESVVRSRRNDDLLTGPGWEPLFGPHLVALHRDPRVVMLFEQWGLSDYWMTVGHRPDFMR
ncbi:MAG TPA: BTAD domain-containing putative transcriptional regulator [Rhizomicrobium sp.]|jgi:DNA-binding SARP family transcriptional activator|nr:BTAD domain-containing putative transcriptional regulator [Rhizomicrobium sp.]